MKLLVKLKTGEEALVVGYGPGKKGRVMAIVVVGAKLRSVKLRDMTLLGYAKIKAPQADLSIDDSDNITALRFH